MAKIMKAGQEITSKSVNANIILNEQTRQANELLRQQRIAQVEEDLQAGVGAFTEDTEIINARRDKDGTIHESLKARLDALPYQIKDINAYTEATLPSEFSTGVTVFPVNGGNPFNGLAGFVTNYKIGSGLDWYKQELRAYGSNQVFSRKTTGGDAWDVWQKISAV